MIIMQHSHCRSKNGTDRIPKAGVPGREKKTEGGSGDENRIVLARDFILPLTIVLPIFNKLIYCG